MRTVMIATPKSAIAAIRRYFGTDARTWKSFKVVAFDPATGLIMFSEVFYNKLEPIVPLPGVNFGSIS